MAIIGVTVATTRSIVGIKHMPFAFWLAFWAFRDRIRVTDGATRGASVPGAQPAVANTGSPSDLFLHRPRSRIKQAPHGACFFISQAKKRPREAGPG
jgi:hypothetical protein